MNSEGSQLAQIRPGGTTAVTGYTNAQPPSGRGLNVEITLIAVCNTTAGTVNFSLYHDNDGTTYDQTTALYYAKPIAANDTVWIAIPAQNSGVAVKPGGSIGVQSSSANALNFTFYGVTQQVPVK